MLRRTLAGLAPAVLLCACAGANGAAPPAKILPLKKLRLYETGVGYFERSGSAAALDASALPVPAGHLDDAIKTLVVLGPGGHATVRGVEFGSSISRGMARVLAGLPAEGGDAPITLPDLLGGLKGASLEVRTAQGVVSGRLVDIVDTSPVEADTKDKAKSSKPSSYELLLLTDASALVRLSSEGIRAVRPLDAGYAARLGSALDALSTQSAESRRLMRVVAGGGPITLGYVAEAPVWRTTYRLVLDASGDGGTLQGWALVHNDTDEDWRGVTVELVNGRPDSFLFPLAAPRYGRRELMTPTDELSTVPQLMATTVDSIWGDRIGEAGGALGLSGVGEGGGGRGEGIGLGSVGTIGHGAGSTEGSSDILDVGNLARVAQANGVEAGALFVYTMPEAVSLRGHASALLPFLDQRIDVRPIAWFEDPDSPARSAVRFVNSTAQTLPAGTIAFFGGGGFAGESALDRLKPGERRFLTYGVDPDVELTTKASHATEEPKRLTWSVDRSELEEHYLRTSDFAFALENRSGRARLVMLAMRLDRNAQLTGPDDVDFDPRAGRPLAVFRIEAKKKADRTAHAVEGLERRTAFASLSATWLAQVATAPSLPAGERTAAGEAAARLREAEDLGKTITQTKAQIEEADKDVQRLREDMKAFGGERAGAAAQPNPFAARVLAAEDRLTALRKKLGGFESDSTAKHDAAKAALAKLAR